MQVGVVHPPLKKDLFMKISKLFHWLYFSVMALPLIVAPIFAIYSHRHDLTTGTPTLVTQYKYSTNDVNSLDDLVEGNAYFLDYTYISPNYTGTIQLDSYSTDFVDFYIDANQRGVLCLDGSFINYRQSAPTSSHGIYPYEVVNFGLCTQDNVGSNRLYLGFGKLSYTLTTSSLYVFDYGENYSTSTNTYFVSCKIGFVYHSDIILSSNIVPYIYRLPDNFNSIVDASIDYQDSDIMSVFVNNYAEAINKYFNFDNAFNFGELYDWMNLTFFNGTAGLGFFIFWHLLIYWLLISIIWLVFDVLMYVPQLVHRWLDKASLS